MNNSPIPIILCIDVEPDERFIEHGPLSPWNGYEASYKFFTELRPTLAAATGSAPQFTWFFRMDPQVAQVYGIPGWAIKNYPEFVAEFESQGDELALHTHAYRWNPDVNSWVVDHGNQEWVDECVRVSFEAFKDTVGRDCDSFRFGDRWMNNATLDLIERLGAKFDLTMEPGHPEIPSYFLDKPFTGSIPDYVNVPRIPYRPLQTDFRKPDPCREDGIYMIPVSTGTHHPGFRERVRLRRFNRYMLKDKFRTLILGINPGFFRRAMDELLSSLEKPYLAVPLRTNVFMNRCLANNARESLNYILTHPKVKQFVFSTPRAALTMMGLHRRGAEIAELF